MKKIYRAKQSFLDRNWMIGLPSAVYPIYEGMLCAFDTEPDKEFWEEISLFGLIPKNKKNPSWFGNFKMLLRSIKIFRDTVAMKTGLLLCPKNMEINILVG